jgi:hypothetical protein
MYLVLGLERLRQTLRLLKDLDERAFLFTARPHPMDENTISRVVECIRWWQDILYEVYTALAAVLKVEQGRARA